MAGAEKQEMIITYMKDSKQVTSKEAMKLLNMTDRGARKFLQRMVMQGLLVARGDIDTERYYVLME